MRDSESDKPTLSLSAISKRAGEGRDRSVTTIAKVLLLELGVDDGTVEYALQDYRENRGEMINPTLNISQTISEVVTTICRATGIPNSSIFIEACVLAGIVTMGFTPKQTED